MLHPDDELDKDEIKTIRKELKKVCKKAEAVMGKRNHLLHAAWGIVDEGVYYSPLPLKEAAFKVGKLVELKKLVSDIRKLKNTVSDLVDLIGEFRGSDSGEP